jgi:hypothetical protein
MRNIRHICAIVTVAGLFALPLAAQAQGIPGGAGPKVRNKAARRRGPLAQQLEV